MIHVCSLAALPETVKPTGCQPCADRDGQCRPGAAAGFGAAGQSSQGVDGRHHRGRRTASSRPRSSHIEQVLNFVRGWDRGAPLVVHCYAGISRSTASAFAAACALNPHRDEIDDRQADPRGLPDRVAEPADRRPRRPGAGARGPHAARARRDGPGRHDGRGPPLPRSISNDIHRASPDERQAADADRDRPDCRDRRDRGQRAADSHRAAGDAGSSPDCRSGRSMRSSHRTFEIGLRAWVEEQAGLRLGYVEQLYTFGDRGRHARPGDTDAHVASIGYLALTRAADNAARCGGRDLRALVSLLPLGGLARGAARHHRARHHPGADALGRPAEQAGHRARAWPQGSRPVLFRPRRRALGRGARARPLRTALRGRAGRGGAARRPACGIGAQDAPRASAHRCGSTTAAFSPRRSRGCAQS